MALNFNTGPYYDDFDPEKKFYKVLYKPGYAVQARELNQMQSIQKHQLAGISNHMFKKNSMVIPGGIVLNPFADIVFISSASNVADLSTLVGRTITNKASFDFTDDATLTNCITAVVLGYRNKTETDPGCLYVKYFKGMDDGRATFNTSETLSTVDSSLVTFQTHSSEESRLGKVATLAPGLFYVNETFVDASAQSIIVELDTTLITNCSIGLLVDESIVTADQDETLLDNANGAPNQYAPGADRYKIDLTLVRVDDANQLDPDRFITLMTIENDVVTYVNDRTQYAEIMKMLARRTYDANGNFVVNGLGVSVNAADDADYLWATVSPGTAYVGGYEYHQIANSLINIAKPRDTDHQETISDVFSLVSGLTYFYVAGSTNTEELPPADTLVQFLTTTPNAAINVTFTDTGDLVTANNHGLVDGDTVVFTTITTTTGISQDTTYYVVNATTNTFKVADAPGGAAKALTTNGTGVMNPANVIGYGVFKDLQFVTGEVGTSDIYKCFFDWVALEDGHSVNDIGGFKVINAAQGAPVLHQMKLKGQTGTFTTGDTITSTTNTVQTSEVFSVIGTNILYVIKTTPNGVPNTEVIKNGSGTTATLIDLVTSNYSDTAIPMIKVDESIIKTVTNLDYSTVEKRVISITTLDRSEEINLTGTQTFEDYSTSDWYAYDVTAQQFIEGLDSYLTFNSATSVTFTVGDGSLDGHTIWLYYTVNKTNVAKSTKTKATGYTYIPSPSNKWMSLNNQDVVAITKVVDSGDPDVDADINTSVDITSRYILDTGNTAHQSGTGLIKLRKNAIPPVGRIAVQYEYYTVNAGNYVCVDSYDPSDSTLNYIGEIRHVFDKKDNVVKTRNYIDFRTRPSAYFFKNEGTIANGSDVLYLKDLNLSSFNTDVGPDAIHDPTLHELVGKYIVGPGYEGSNEIVEVDYDATTGCTKITLTDAVVGDQTGTYYIGLNTASLSLIDVSAGAKSFTFPKDGAKMTYSYVKFTPKHALVYINRIDDLLKVDVMEVTSITDALDIRRNPVKMPLVYIYMEPYTVNMNDVKVTKFDNPVYQMIDIHQIKLRTDRNEYYTSLALNRDLEQEILDVNAEGATTASRGFFNEDFTELASQAFNSPDFACTVYNKSYVSPGVVTRTIPLELDITQDNTTWQKTGSTLTLPYTEIRAFGNRKASVWNNLNPYNTINWGSTGKLTLIPAVDNWVDVTVAPDITIDPPVIDTNPPPVNPEPPVDEIVTEINNLRTSWGKDSKGGYHAITFDWKTNLGRTGRVNTDWHLSDALKNLGSKTSSGGKTSYDGTYAKSLINKRYNDAGVKAYLNAGTHFDIKPPSKW